MTSEVQYVRSHVQRYHVNPRKVVVKGGSAGGDLAVSLGVRWNEPLLRQMIKVQSDEIRPDGIILGYPVITAGPFTHKGSMKNLTAEDAPVNWHCQSLEHLVGSETLPAFCGILVLIRMFP